MLLPGVAKRVYNLQSKQLIKLFSRILLQDEDEMLEHLEQGDVAETIRVFHEKSVAVEATERSVLTIQEVNLPPINRGNPPGERYTFSGIKRSRFFFAICRVRRNK